MARRTISLPRRYGAFVLTVPALMAIGPVRGDGTANPAAVPPAPPPAAADIAARITGDWGGLRPRLAERGLTIGGTALLDVSRNLTGGLRSNLTAVRDLIHIHLALDTRKAFALPGGTFYLDFASHNGTNGTADLVGDAQGFDNQDAPRFNQVYEVWYQQKLLGDTFRLKAGKMDANSEFAVQEYGREFLGSTMAYSTTISAMPTYPNPAPGAEVFFKADNHFDLGGGVFYDNGQQATFIFTGRPQETQSIVGGVFLIGEAGYHWALPGGDLHGHVTIGGWGHTGDFPRLSGGLDHGAQGFYGFVDQCLCRVQGIDGQVCGLGAFLQGGLSDGAVSPMAAHIGGGVSATGLIPGRPNDVQGIGANWVQFGDQPNLPYSYELSVEAFYKLQLTPWLSAKPDVQYIRHPGGTFSDAVVLTLRMQMNF